MEIARRDIVEQAQRRLFAFIVFSFDVDPIPVRLGSTHGTETAKPADETPGIAASLSWMLF